MIQLNYSEIEVLNGGNDLIDGVCDAVTVGGAVTFVAKLAGAAINPIFGAAMGIAGAGCGAYTLWKYLS